MDISPKMKGAKSQELTVSHAVKSFPGFHKAGRFIFVIIRSLSPRVALPQFADREDGLQVPSAAANILINIRRKVTKGGPPASGLRKG
jgi:hypothetical protein